MRALLLVVVSAVGCATLPPPAPVPLPATTPEEIGKLVVKESLQSEHSSTMVLSYTNDTPLPFQKVRLECMLLDHVRRVVNSDSIELEGVEPGAEITKALKVNDAHGRAENVECRIASAKQRTEG